MFPIYCFSNLQRKSDFHTTMRPDISTTITTLAKTISTPLKISLASIPNTSPTLSGLPANPTQANTSPISLSKSTNSTRAQGPVPSTSRVSWSEMVSWVSKMGHSKAALRNTWSTTSLLTLRSSSIGKPLANGITTPQDVDFSIKDSKRMSNKLILTVTIVSFLRCLLLLFLQHNYIWGKRFCSWVSRKHVVQDDGKG